MKDQEMSGWTRLVTPSAWTLREKLLLPAAAVALLVAGLASGLVVWRLGALAAAAGGNADLAGAVAWKLALSDFALLLLFLAAALAWLWRYMSEALRPLDELAEAADLAQREGDLRWRVTVSGRQDQVGRLGRAFEAMLKRMAELPVTLSVQAERLSEGVQAVKRDHAAQRSILATQASALTQTQVTSEEIRQTSRQAAAQAKTMIAEAAKARDLSRSGGEALGKSLDSLLAIRSRVELLAADVEALEGRARRIEGIIDSVKDLADQSNLLALNAAIEAMRAGAQGQGFGLVAREIRALADQSIAATEQVRQVLGDLNDGVREAAKASREGVHDIQKGLERVQGSAETLADIQVTVGESVGQLERIAAVVQQQDAGLTQVFLALQDQGQRMAEAERQQERTTVAVGHLEESAEAVEKMIKGFKI
jgi:methyl-accepting chemotaxis protein